MGKTQLAANSDKDKQRSSMERDQVTATSSRERSRTPSGRDRIIAPVDHMSIPPPGWADQDKNRRQSTIHSYTLQQHQSLPTDANTMLKVQEMTSGKAMKNVLALSFAFMFIYVH